MEIKHSVSVQRPIEDVFAYAANPETHPLWRLEVVSMIEHRQGATRAAGDRWDQVMNVMGRKVESSSHITAYEPSTRFAWEDKESSMPSTGSMTFEENGQGTLVTLTMTTDPTGLVRLAQPLVRKQVQRTIETSLLNLKEILEGSD